MDSNFQQKRGEKLSDNWDECNREFINLNHGESKVKLHIYEFGEPSQMLVDMRALEETNYILDHIPNWGWK